MKFFLFILSIIVYWSLFYYSNYFVKNDTFSVVDNLVNSLYFKFKSPYVNNSVKKDLHNIVFVWIDDKFFKKYNKTPFDLNNMDYLSFLSQIYKDNPKYVLFDWKDLSFVWNKYMKFLWIHSKAYKDYLIETFEKWNQIVLSPVAKKKTLLWYDKYSDYLKKYFGERWLSLWNTDFKKWKDGLIQWFDIYYKNKLQVPLWYMLYLKENNILKPKLKNKDGFLDIYDANNLIKQVPLTKWNNILFSPLVSFSKIKYYSILDVMNDKQNNFLKKKIVFLWVNSDSYRNVKTYAWVFPSLQYQINLYLSLKNDLYYKKIDNKYILYYLYLIYFLSIIILFIKKDYKYVIWILFTSILISVYLYYLFLSQILVFINLWTIISILIIALFANLILWLLNSYIKRKEITNLFDKYIWKEVLEKKEQKNSSNKISEQKKVFILFTDIEWFTNISERLKPQQTIDMLNIYFKYMNQEIEKSGWFIDKYVWDAVIAFWEDKKYSDNILKVILNIKILHKKINKEIQEKISSDITLNTRFGVHYGEVIVWDIWDESWKISYTIIWDNVNLASRLEWINKYYWTNIIISENILSTIKHSGNFYYRLLDKITVKWKKEWIKIYELISTKSEFSDLEYVKYIRKFEKWIYYYFTWSFITSFWILSELKQEKYSKNDNALNIMYKRVKILKESPPKDWDGIWRYNTK